MQPPGNSARSYFLNGLRNHYCRREMEARPSFRLLKTVQSLTLLLSFFTYLTPLSAYLPLSSDILTLLRFKEQLEADPSRLVSDTWNANALNADGCPEKWYGITCHQGNVSEVRLENLGLQGELKNGTLGDLPGLVSLSLANNSLKGTLPDDFGYLVNLAQMDLSDNNFEGSIPDTFVRLSQSLQNLSLANNRLSGSIPDGLGFIYSLTELDLSRNQLNGSIPSSFSMLVHLVTLNLSSNDFFGEIPDGFDKLTQLEQLDFHNNQLSGSISPTLFTPNQIYVDLSLNNFTGFLPWQQIVNTGEYVNLSHNQFSGSFAPEPLFVSTLKVLDISNNELSGNLPNFESWRSVTSLFLSNNKFTGSIPTALLGNAPWEEIDLSYNKLNGTIGSIKAQLLKRLDLSKNQLDGPLPAGLGACESVDLSGNKLLGDISELLNEGKALKRLDLSSNLLNGFLPDQIMGYFDRLTYLNLSHNQFEGPVPSEYGSSGAASIVSIIDLSFNRLEGPVPSSFFYSEVTALLLSHNQLTGPIPLLDGITSSPDDNKSNSPSGFFGVDAQRSPLSPLEVLDLSVNNFSGPIPERISSYVSLRTLNLSSNQLSGKMPQLSGLNGLVVLDLSENDLSGSLPPQLPSTLEVLNLTNNDFSGQVPLNLTKFNTSSFFPGNDGLQWPLLAPPPGGSNPFSGVTITRSGSKMKSAVKAGLIGGCSVGAALVVAMALFIYFRSLAKSNEASPGSEFGGSKGFERCGKPGNGSTTDFDADVEGSNVNSCTPAATLKSGSVRRGRGSPTGNGSPDLNVEDGDIVDGGLLAGRNGRLPCVIERDVLSPEHPLVTKVSPEHPTDMKCPSPEQLVGDVYFLDKAFTFSAEDLSRAPAEVLGRSSHGTSYKAVLGNGHVLAVKWLKEGLAKSKKDFGLEARKFGNVKHQNIVSMRGYYWGPREHEKLILSDYVDGGSLAGRLYERTGRRLPPLLWQQRLQIAVDVARGLVYLHVQHHWAHGNIKASNVLIREDPQFEACLSDFSLHRLMTSAGTANQILNSGALGYRAPELSAAKKPKPSIKSDVFSFGVILMELITGKSAGDIISGATGVVDLPDWVRLVANEGHAIDCYDTALVGVDRELEPPQGIEEMLNISLNCIAPQSSRPSIRVVYEELAAINPD